MTDHGKDSPQIAEFLRFAANGNGAGAEWLHLWHRYNHAVDDVIDENLWDAETLLRLLVQACECYSHHFYVAHLDQLQTPALLATRTYGDSVDWEKGALWKRHFAEVMRHAGNEVICAVALICGGFEHLTKVSAPLMASCAIYHADKYGWVK